MENVPAADAAPGTVPPAPRTVAIPMAAKTEHDLQQAHRRRKNRESFLETLESIVVAFVLAFIFRAFVVEAFVIPTGSMGPTLYGQHLECQCSDCGYEFAVGTDGAGELRTACPNCGLVQRIGPPDYSGDRILVLKFLYDFEAPRRWDVIVFRNPNEPEENYIKRLIGLPGETLELVQGDVTIDGRVVHKTDRAQEALWMIVHDTRYPATRSDWNPVWIADPAWERTDCGFALARAPPADKPAWLAYEHHNARGGPDNIRDYYAYNSAATDWRMGASVCTDLGLKTEVTADSADTVLVVEMRAWKDRFRFVLPAEGAKENARILLNGQVVAEADGGVLPVGRAADVQVANVDRALVMLVNGRRVTTRHQRPVTLKGDVTYTPTPMTEDQRRPYEEYPVPGVRPPLAYELRVGLSGGTGRLGYLRLDRDVYYVNEMIRGPTGIEKGHGTEGNPLALRAGEYFVCGDNSPKSFDGRLWPLDRPVVPQRNLVGKAFFVYWPAAGTRYHIPLAPDPRGWRLVH